MLYGAMFEELNRALLELGGFGANRHCSAVWPEPLPYDINEALLADQLEIASKDTLASKLGFDYDKEKPKIEEEKQSSTEAARKAFDNGNVPPLQNTDRNNGSRFLGSNQGQAQ